MARTPYRGVELTEALRPVAAPVDTFVQPQAPSRDTSLQDLARSLSGLGGSLAGMVGQRDKEAEEQDRLRGEAAFHQSTAKGIAEAVAAGSAPAQYSQAFMRGWKRAQGDVAGGQLLQQFDAEFGAWPGKTSADPKAYDTFVTDFLRKNIKTDDPDVLAGLNPRLRQLSDTYLHRQIGEASKAATQGMLQASAAQDSQTIEAAVTAGLASRKGFDYEDTFRQIEARREAKLKLGANVQEYDRQVVVDGITAAAVLHRDPKILNFLDRKVPGQDYTWANTPYGRDQRQKTIGTLESMGRQSIQDDEKRRREEKAEAKDSVTRDSIRWAIDHPREPMPEELLARGEKLDPDFRLNVLRNRKQIADDRAASDPGDLLALSDSVLNGGGIQAVQRAYRDGVIRNRSDLEHYYKLAEGREKDGPALTAVFSSEQSKAVQRSIRERTLTQNSVENILDPDGMSDTGLAAWRDYRLQLMAWRAANPNADAIAQQDAIDRIGGDILKRLTIQATGGATYNREGLSDGNPYVSAPAAAPKGPGAAVPAGGANPAVTPAPNPMQQRGPTSFGDFGGQVPGELSIPPEAAGPVQAPAVPSPVPATPGPATATPRATAQPAPQATSPDAVSTWLGGLTADQRGRLELKAAEEKKPLLLKAQEVYDRLSASGAIKPPAAPAQPPAAVPGRQSLRAPDGTPIETASATGADDYEGDRQEIAAAFARAIGDTKRRPLGGYVSAQLRDDPQAARILDFVAGPESNGNYNAFYSNGRSTRDLSAMSLDQVIAWSGNRGTASSATGRYQFMRKTLQGLKAEMGLAGSEAFTPALQDRLALQLLERRGYSAWRAGSITDAQFANRLALEWASLPNITAQNGRPAGVSAYAGDGLNKSLVSPAAVMAALRGRGEGSPAATGFLGRLLGRRRARPGAQPDDSDQTRI